MSRLLRMHEPIAHRGPDGEGFLGVTPAGELLRAASADEFESLVKDDMVASLAFRWLKIQDVSEAARQPMSSADRTVWIAFNGEIYNFRELRAELEGRGHRFRTHGDTEVALAAYVEWDTQCFERFNGMWAILIFDLSARCLVVSRDRLGIKPLFFAKRESSLLFASEAKQIACSGAVAPEPDLDTMARFVAGDRPRLGRTFFDGVHAFPAGCYSVIAFEAPRIEPRPYWRLAGVLGTREGMSFDAAADTLEELLTSSVAMELIAEVGVGTLLSGGLDSSLVTALATRAGPTRRPAFSFVLNERIDRRLDESAYIDDVVRATGVPSHRTTMNGAWLRDNLARVTWAQETPVTGAPVFAQFRTHELAAASGVRVVLDGQGADEMFGGYIRHQPLILNDLLLHGRLVRFARELAAFQRASPRYLRTYLRRGLVSPLLGPIMRRMGRRRAPAWFLGETAGGGTPESRPATSSLLNRALYRDMTELNMPMVLGITDRNSMAHSIEARVPFLDHRIVELAFSLPASFKIGGGERKRLLRSVARAYVPESVTGRTDSVGFGTPQSRWMRGVLREPIEEAAEAHFWDRSPLFDGDAVRRLVRNYVSGQGSPSDEGQVWQVYALQAWYAAFGIRG